MSSGRIVVCAILAAILVSLLLTPASACTIFSISDSDTILVGNNEDWNHTNFSVRFYPEDSLGFGHVTFTHTEDPWDIRAGMNTHGVFIDSAWVPPSNVTIDPHKPFLYRNFFKYVLQTCTSVNDSIDIFSSYNIAETWDWQILVADGFGESIVIVAGPNDTVEFVRRNETYQLITNGNIVQPELGQSAWSEYRYNTAQALLEQMGTNITVASCRDVLDAAHATGTAFSSVYDLVNREVYVYFNHDYTREVKFNLEDELALGGHSYEIQYLYETMMTSNTNMTTTTTSIPTPPPIGGIPDYRPFFLSVVLLLVLIIILAVRDYKRVV